MLQLGLLRRKYEYRPLEGENTFRLLSLHAGRGDKIVGSIRHHVLGSPTSVNYTAISYTWGKDIPRFPIYLPKDNSVVVVGENLRNALRWIRNDRSNCNVWVDAICIDQHSTEERNHQVRLMAQIYGNAHMVLVWLQSAGEKSDDAAKAFKFVSAAVSYDTTKHSVYNYSEQRCSNNEDHELASEWRSLYKMCSMRYWTRKWIIQELVYARVVVLQVGSSTCSMNDFEKFCRQLHSNQNGQAHRSLGAIERVLGTRGGIRSLILGSPAVRLALQRLETQEAGYLYELVERYARNQCELPCDHVYALYNLVGNHRVYLRVDYGQTHEQRLVEVVNFVKTHERIYPSKVFDFVMLLMELFRLSTEDVVHRSSLASSLRLEVLVSVLGSVVLGFHATEDETLRNHVKSLRSMPSFEFDTRQEPWVFTVSEGQNGGIVGRSDQTHFSIRGTDHHGLAACRLGTGDVIWQFPGTKYAFVVGSMPGPHRVRIVGRAYLYPTDDAATRNNVTRHSTRRIVIDLATLLELGSLALSSKDGRTEVEEVEDVEDVEKRRNVSTVGGGGLWQRRLKLVSMMMTTLGEFCPRENKYWKRKDHEKKLMIVRVAVGFIIGMILIDIHFVHGVPL